ncbi:DNA polymerase III subunit gamma/tau [Kamptonema formosum]|uniref:DNA polymerase III subunit gamma/tau n=1 Tax=Kamptonema formosum TaxID=331992 RepID=UPI000349EFD5|nr:DNA polymerase III subunit gamma/tau [Oscillatoria sp. PCC 10802]
MSYEPLHHKYRPQTFAALVGQDAIAQTLGNAIRQNKIAPAYLLTGPRGTGKTSSARILAKSLNCLASKVPTEHPCGQCDVCQRIASGTSMDVIEIDAASNTGVDNIRELIERAQFAPVQCRHKVYIIDECHMLSTAAFNSLLKTLEEPPPRVVFVLATTDPQRVLSTIISRCQRFDFRRIPLDAMVRHLTDIARKENINIAGDALTLVAQIAQGGLRDAESLLDQLSLLIPPVTVEKVWDLVGAVPERDLMALLKAIADDSASAVLDQARHIMNRGREPLILLQNLASFYRDLLIAKTAPARSDLVAITPPTWAELCDFAQNIDLATILAGQKHLQGLEVQIKNTTQPRLWLEVALLGLLKSATTAQPATGTGQQISFAAPSPAPNSPPPKQQQPPPPLIPKSPNPGIPHSPAPPAPPPPAPPAPAQAARPAEMPVEPAETQASPPAADAAEQGSDLEQVWQQVLAQIQQRSTQALLRQHGKLVALNANLARIIIRSHPLLEMAKNGLPSVKTAFERVLNGEVRVSLELPGAAPPASGPAETKPPPPQDLGSPPPAPSPTPAPEIRLTPQQPKPPEMPAETPASPSAGAAPLPVDAKREDRPEDRIEDRIDASPANAVGMDALTAGRWEEEDVKFSLDRLVQYFKGEMIVLPLPDGAGPDAPAPEEEPEIADYDLPLYGSSDAEESYLEEVPDYEDPGF